MNNKSLNICILAAGKGTRMSSDIPKVLHEINNKPIIHFVIEKSFSLNPNKIILIIGYKKNLLKQSVENFDIKFAYQYEQKGTAHAIEQCIDQLKTHDGNTLILSGDVPLISNIINESQGPEIISKNNDKISILSSNGTLLYEIPLYNDEPISLVPWTRDEACLDNENIPSPDWNPELSSEDECTDLNEEGIGNEWIYYDEEKDDLALVNGNRLYVFKDVYDPTLSYWLNPRSTPSNYPKVSGTHNQSENADSDSHGIDMLKAYNYPNPVENNYTKFRFYVYDSNEVKIDIYDAAGYKVKFLEKKELILNEYNEILWDQINLPAGLYFAVISSDSNQEKVIKVLIL